MRRFAIASAVLVALMAVSVLAPAKTGGGDADLSDMSIDDMQTSADTMVQNMEAQLATSFKLLEEALAGTDADAINVRNEAITAMKGLVKLSEENYMTLQQKSAEGDRAGVEHEYVKISIAQAKVTELFAQVRTAGGIDMDIEAANVEKTLDIEGTLPLDTDTPAQFADPGNTATVPADPPHASPIT